MTEKRKARNFLLKELLVFCFQHVPPNQVSPLPEAWVLVSIQLTLQFNKQKGKGTQLPVEQQSASPSISTNAVPGGPTS